MENRDLETKLCNSVEKTLEQLVVDDGIREEDVKFIGDLIDIKKDIANMNYWDAKEEMMDMRYMGRGRNSYGTNYGARHRDSSGRYMNGGNYGRNYRGHEIIDDMSDNYGTYMEGRDRYGADDSTMKSLEYMLESVVDFIEMLHEEATSPQEVEMIKRYARKISEM